MVDASTNKPTSPDLQAADVAAAKNNASQARPTDKVSSASPHLAAAATIDELLAKEALANLKRTRATAHAETFKSKARIPVPPATLVVKPPQSQAWKTPFITLAVMVGISTFLCTGGVAYLFLRPVAVTTTSDAELRNIRESVAQLRRTVAALSNDLAANRTALDAANKAVSDRLGRIVQSLERVDRDQSVSATKIERMAEEKAQVVRTASTASSSEVTGFRSAAAAADKCATRGHRRLARAARLRGRRHSRGTTRRDRSRARPGSAEPRPHRGNQIREQPLAGLDQQGRHPSRALTRACTGRIGSRCQFDRFESRSGMPWARPCSKTLLKSLADAASLSHRVQPIDLQIALLRSVHST